LSNTIAQFALDFPRKESVCVNLSGATFGRFAKLVGATFGRGQRLGEAQMPYGLFLPDMDDPRQ
jgi:hypothetical protein